MSQIKQKIYWKSIADKTNSQEFNSFLENEFPKGTIELSETMSRKKFIALMGASMAMAGLVGCRKPVQKILPYVHSPEEIIPGIPNKYATTIPFNLNSYGVIVESHEGRPTHIEGNFNHSSSLGATNSFIQASILDLYDPDRSKYIRYQNKQSSISAFSKALVELINIVFVPSCLSLRLSAKPFHFCLKAATFEKSSKLSL